jgi:hypothetical protein
MASKVEVEREQEELDEIRRKKALQQVKDPERGSLL